MLQRKVVMIGIALIVVGLVVSVYLLHVPRDMFAPMSKVIDLATTSDDEHSPVWSPDGKIIFHIRDKEKQREIWKVDAEGNNATFLAGVVCCNVVFSSDKKDIFYITEITSEIEDKFIAYTMGIDSENIKQIAELILEKKYVEDGPTGSYIGATKGPMYDMHSWSPDRTKIFLTKLEETGYTWVWNEKEGKWRRYKAGTEPPIPVVQWYGQEEKLIAKEHERTAWIWDLKESELRFAGHISYGIVHYTPVAVVVWSPDGKYVALPSIELSEAGATGQIFVINMETGESRRLTSLGVNDYPKWSSDSGKIVYVRMQPKYWWMPFIPESSMGYDVWMVNFDGSNEKQLTNISNNMEEGWLSPDGSKVVYSSWKWKNEFMGVDETQEIEIWMMNDYGKDRKLLTKVDTGGIESMEWSPDGAKIAFVTWELREDGFDRDIYVIDMWN